tara:strand:+ start:122 stop:364 length:243 start_codon:yes stop_codon:yes gene_type:complete
MSNEELENILKTLTESPSIFKTAIEIYNTTDDLEIKKELGEQIKKGKESFERLDILLEDLQWDIETELVNKLMEKNEDSA